MSPRSADEQDEQLQQRVRDAAVESGRTGQRLDIMRAVDSYVETVGIDRKVLRHELGTALLQVVDPWDVCFGRLEAYQEERGDCLVPVAYETEGGFKLGKWVDNQRTKYKGKRGGLTEEQRERLEGLGMVWEPLEAAWEEGLQQLAMYQEERGDCLVPQGYETEGGFKLGTWVDTQRQKYKGNRGRLTEEQRARLEGLGMVWDRR